MGNPLESFTIEVVVGHRGKDYRIFWEKDSLGCNHYENLESVATYIAQEIKREIKTERVKNNEHVSQKVPPELRIEPDAIEFKF